MVSGAVRRHQVRRMTGVFAGTIPNEMPLFIAMVTAIVGSDTILIGLVVSLCPKPEMIVGVGGSGSPGLLRRLRPLLLWLVRSGLGLVDSSFQICHLLHYLF